MPPPTLRAAEQALAAALAPEHGAREAAAIARAAAEALVGRTARLLGATEPMHAQDHARWQAWAERLVAGEPLQYVTGRAAFLDLELEVGPAVLIPRPETEELVRWAAETLRGVPQPRLVDVGTGSGAIALALRQLLPQADVTGVDVSAEALAVAASNGAHLGLEVHWQRMDVLAPEAEAAFAQLDALVSNPPYVPPDEAPSLAAHVRDHEPHLALFTPTADALVFYCRLAALGPRWLRPGGWLLVELHTPLAEATLALFQTPPWTGAELRADLQGRLRMLRAQVG